jgi:hypothetical protein
MQTVLVVFEDPLSDNERRTVEIGTSPDPRAISGIIDKTIRDGLSAQCDYDGRPAKVLYAPRTILAILAVEDSRIKTPDLGSIPGGTD